MLAGTSLKIVKLVDFDVFASDTSNFRIIKVVSLPLFSADYSPATHAGSLTVLDDHAEEDLLLIMIMLGQMIIMRPDASYHLETIRRAIDCAPDDELQYDELVVTKIDESAMKDLTVSATDAYTSAIQLVRQLTADAALGKDTTFVPGDDIDPKLN